MIDGIYIGFPETEVSLGPRVLVRSRRIKGQSLSAMIYDQEMQGFALDIAMVALKALSRADVTSKPFVLFGTAYGLIRRLKTILSETWDASVLSPEQRVKLNHLVSSYAKPRKGERKVLVHGDLHASNLVVDCEERSLGFVDLEMMHIGKSVTNFAQLWISFHFAAPSLGRKFYQRYMNQFPEMLDGHFDSDVRAEVALRCHSMVKEAEKIGHAELEEKSRVLLGNVLKGESFEKFVL
jgi:aminoglycoside phosphotransferase (APT) family kinase protein